jgi:hypothetical protein
MPMALPFSRGNRRLRRVERPCPQSVELLRLENGSHIDVRHRSVPGDVPDKAPPATRMQIAPALDIVQHVGDCGKVEHHTGAIQSDSKILPWRSRSSIARMALL